MSGGCRLVHEANEAWRHLHGLFCVYKPPRTSMDEMFSYIATNITQDLNSMHINRPRYRVEIVGSLAGKLSVRKVQDFSTHPLVLGDLFEKTDIKLTCAYEMEDFASGVCLLGINKLGAQQCESLQRAQLLSSYSVEGRLGVATRDGFYTSKPVERSSYDHVTSGRLDRVLTKLQSNQQRRMIDQLGLPPNSQAAYEIMSTQGLVRPSERQQPILYDMRLVEWGKPHFTIEVTGVNIYSHYLLTLINDIGLLLKTNAHALQVRCLRQGPFGLDWALLRKHWRIGEVIRNIGMCGHMVTKSENENVGLVKLEDFKKEQEEEFERKKRKREMEEEVRRQMGRRMIEEFTRDKPFKEYAKFLKEHQV